MTFLLARNVQKNNDRLKYHSEKRQVLHTCVRGKRQEIWCRILVTVWKLCDPAAVGRDCVGCELRKMFVLKTSTGIFLFRWSNRSPNKRDLLLQPNLSDWSSGDQSECCLIRTQLNTRDSFILSLLFLRSGKFSLRRYRRDFLSTYPIPYLDSFRSHPRLVAT